MVYVGLIYVWVYLLCILHLHNLNPIELIFGFCIQSWKHKDTLEYIESIENINKQIYTRNCTFFFKKKNQLTINRPQQISFFISIHLHFARLGNKFGN